MSEISQELKQVVRETITDNDCYAEIVNIERRDKFVNVIIELPDGIQKTLSFPKPKTNSPRKYLIVRLLRSEGLTLGQADELVGKKIRVTVQDDGEVTHLHPSQDLSVVERVKRNCKAVRSRILGG